MEQIPTEMHSEERNEASRKFKENGSLGVTAEDHLILGSTPPEILEINPGKTLAELWTEKEIFEYLNGMQQFLDTDGSDEKLIANGYIHRIQDELDAAKNHLKDIGRLPKGFE